MKKMTKAGLRKLIKEQIGRSNDEGHSIADDVLFDAITDYITAKEEEVGYGTPIQQLKTECMRIVQNAFDELDGVGYGPGGY
tara:strand:+ start:2698 stop:2943 length:246 start_codon:yes stop_codon:yes gene_type:complete